MTNISPILYVHGTVRQVTPRTVPHSPAKEAEPAVYDDRGNMTRMGRPAREAREAYDVHDVVIDTFRPASTIPCGLIEVLITPKSAEATGGYLPSVGDAVEWPVRGYEKWQGREGRRFRTNGYSLAGDVYAAERAGSNTREKVSA